MTHLSRSATGALLLALCSTSVFANSLGVGVSREPDYVGSDDYRFLPKAAFELNTRIGTLRNSGLGAKLDITKSDVVETGPVLRLNGGRNDSVSDELVSLLPEVEATAEAGWYVSSGFTLQRFGFDTEAIVIGELSVVTDIGDGHGGTIVNASFGLVMPINDTLRIIPSFSLTYTDDNYAKAFYGVDTNAATASGLNEFSATGGIESTQVALVLIRTLSKRWSITGTAAYSVLQGDASASPVTLRGDDKQVFTGVVANYHF